MPSEISKVVILARGLGTRMRKAADAPGLDVRQAAAADTGVKAMIPIDRPFLDYALSGLADAGYRDVCLVIGPEHDAIRRYYTETVTPVRLRVSFAVQDRPLGTAHAVAAAETFAGGDEFLALNSDNYYPEEALRALRTLGQPGLAGFDRQALVADGNVDAERVRTFAVVSVGPDGCLTGIVEKPGDDTWQRVGEHALISMNCWRFGPSVFEAARRIGLSPRGEYEIADAVEYARTRLGERFAVVPVASGVLDLSRRTDIPSVTRRLKGRDVRL